MRVELESIILDMVVAVNLRLRHKPNGDELRVLYDNLVGLVGEPLAARITRLAADTSRDLIDIVNDVKLLLRTGGAR